jgi:aspartate aminotransferase-like enzyme
VKRYRLMIPGPTEMDAEVLAEMGKPLVAHYGSEWTEFFHQTVERMKEVMRAERAELYLMVGPGSAALDAAIGNVVADGKPILIAANGHFGKRLHEIACSYTPRAQLVEEPVGEAIDPQRIEDALKRESDVKVVALVHCETSTGVLNPVREVAEVCSRYEAILIVDTISSLGGVEFRFDEWDIGICVSSTQKCLEVPPGLAPLAISPRAWTMIQKTPKPGWYLNLQTWRRFMEEWGDWHPHPVTMSSGLVQALHHSLGMIMEEGLEARWRRHEDTSRLFCRGLENLGFRLVAAQQARSPTVSAVWAHESLRPEQLIQFLKAKHGTVIAGGLDALRGRIFRVGHMGPTACLAAVLPLLFAMEEALRDVGQPIALGESLHRLEVS